jgi:hypothetical protein
MFTSDENDYFKKPCKPVYRRVAGRVIRMELPRPDKYEVPSPGFEYANLVYVDLNFNAPITSHKTEPGSSKPKADPNE